MTQQGKRSGRLPVVLVVLACVIALVLASPYWFGRQAEQGHAQYAQEIQAFPYLQVSNYRYERGYLASEARYELLLSDMAGQLLDVLADAFELDDEPLRIHVVERLRHGPVPGGDTLFAAAAVDGELWVEGSLTTDVLRFEGDIPRQNYTANVGFDGLVQGSWGPVLLDLVSGPVLLREKWDARYRLEQLGGEFTHDLGSGRFHSTARMGTIRFEDPDGVTTSEESTTEMAGQFVNGRMGWLKLETVDPLTVIEQHNSNGMLHMELEDQRTELSVDFDSQGRLQALNGTWALGGLRAEDPEEALDGDGIAVVFNAQREGEFAWYGGLRSAMDRLAMAQNGETVLGARDLAMGLHLQPASADMFQLRFELAGEDLQSEGLDPIGLEVQMQLGELRRAGYEDLWRLLYQLGYELRLDDPSMPPGIMMAMSQAALEMVGERPHLLVEPVRFRHGDASSELAMEARVQLMGMMMFGVPGLLQPGNELRFSADVASELVRSGVQEYLRQQAADSGSELSPEELRELADELIRSEVQPVLEQGLLRFEDGRYRMSMELEDGRLLLNGEPADWLLDSF